MHANGIRRLAEAPDPDQPYINSVFAKLLDPIDSTPFGQLKAAFEALPTPQQPTPGWPAMFSTLEQRYNAADKPRFIVPDLDLARRVSLAPRVHAAWLRWGDVLLWSAWQDGLSPRTYFHRKTEGTDTPRLLISLVRTEVHGGYGPSLETLQRSSQIVEYNSCLRPGERGKPLAAVMADLYARYTIKVNAFSDFIDYPLCIRAGSSATFSSILDLIAVELRASWEWQDDVVILQPQRCGDRPRPCRVAWLEGPA